MHIGFYEVYTHTQEIPGTSKLNACKKLNLKYNWEVGQFFSVHQRVYSFLKNVYCLILNKKSITCWSWSTSCIISYGIQYMNKPNLINLSVCLCVYLYSKVFKESSSNLNNNILP